MTEAAEAAPKWLRERLRTVPRIAAAELARLIADLDSDDFDRREAASKELAALGPQAESALRKALEETTSAEVRSRIGKLLKPLDSWVVTDPDALRSSAPSGYWSGSARPRRGPSSKTSPRAPPEVRQTQEAKAALDFLDKRAAAKP